MVSIANPWMALIAFALATSLSSGADLIAVEKRMKHEEELPADDGLAQTVDMDAKRAESLGSSKEKLAGLLTLAVKNKGPRLSHRGQALTVKKSKAVPPKINFFAPEQTSAHQFEVTDPLSKETIAFGQVDIDMILNHGYFPKCCKPDRIMVVFENPHSLERLAKEEAASKLPVEKRERPAVVPPDGVFSIGGVNGQAAIQAVTEFNGVVLSEIETALKKGPVPWLGQKEGLRELLALDNAFAHAELHATHQMLAEPMESLSSRGKVGATRQVDYKGLLYSVRIQKRSPPIESPFGAEEPDDRWVTIISKATGKKIEYPKIIEPLIWRYGFYGGRSSARRLEPKRLVELFPTLKK